MPTIGLDIVDITRIDKGIKRFEDRYIRRVLGPDEINLLKSRRDQAQFVAGRFAAKEALIKALAPHLKNRPSYRTLQVVYDATGQPRFKLPSEIESVLQGYDLLLSITHERTTAAAVVVIMEKR